MIEAQYKNNTKTKNQKTKKEHDLAQHDRGAIHKTTQNMKSFGKT